MGPSVGCSTPFAACQNTPASRTSFQLEINRYTCSDFTMPSDTLKHYHQQLLWCLRCLSTHNINNFHDNLQPTERSANLHHTICCLHKYRSRFIFTPPIYCSLQLLSFLLPRLIPPLFNTSTPQLWRTHLRLQPATTPP